jgi:hypothetical protein
MHDSLGGLPSNTSISALVSRRRALALISLAASLFGCDKLRVSPEAQKIFTNGWKDLLKEYERASTSKNSVQEGEVNDRIASYFAQSRDASAWLGSVSSVKWSLLGREIHVLVTYDGIEYFLLATPADHDLLTRIEKLRQGDSICFTGQVGRERSWTARGRATHPSVEVHLTTID